MRTFRNPRCRGRCGLLAALSLVLSFGLAGCRRPKSPEERVSAVKEFLSDRLELDAKQQTSLDVAGGEALALMKEFKDGRSADLVTLAAQLEGDLDPTMLTGAYQKRRALLDQHLPKIVDKLVAFHRTLNNDQKAQLGAWLKKHTERLEGE